MGREKPRLAAKNITSKAICVAEKVLLLVAVIFPSLYLGIGKKSGINICVACKVIGTINSQATEFTRNTEIEWDEALLFT